MNIDTPNIYNDYPLVSIAVVTYNQLSYLKECINSCLDQDYPNYEIVVADDYSRDGTQEYLHKLQKRIPNKINLILSEYNSGITNNCNNAWKKSSGEWIKTIAGDDMLKPNCLSIYMNEIFKSEKEIDVYFADMLLFSFDKRNKTRMRHLSEDFKLPSKKLLDLLYVSNRFLAPSAFIKKSSLHSIGYADERYEMLEDYPLWVKFIRNNMQFAYISTPTVMYRLGDSVSGSIYSIGNEKYLDNLFHFQKNEIWPSSNIQTKIKILGDYIEYMSKKIGIKYFNNNPNNKIYRYIFKIIYLINIPKKIYYNILKNT